MTANSPSKKRPVRERSYKIGHFPRKYCRPRAHAATGLFLNRPLSAEALAAGATAGRVGIRHLEPAPLKRFDVVQFAAAHVKRALGIDDHFNAGALNKNIAVRQPI